MKKKAIIKIVIFFTFFPLCVCAQAYKMYSTENYHNQLRLNTMTGEVLQIQDDGQSWTICSGIEFNGTDEGRFCLYKTQNMWTFILLDTYTGKNWQVQFSVKGKDYMFTVPINMYYLAYPQSNSKWTNRFQMFATQNMWTFILLDSYNGRLWQVQYNSQDLKNLMCIPINDKELVTTETGCTFSIQPLTSMYQYYLINDKTGQMWKFQWTTKGDEYRWIQPFY